MGICINESNGGVGYDLLSACIVLEELSRCCASIGIIASIHNCLYAELVQCYGTPEQIDVFLRPFTNGQIGAFALTEQSKTIKCNAIRLLLRHFNFQTLDLMQPIYRH